MIPEKSRSQSNITSVNILNKKEERRTNGNAPTVVSVDTVVVTTFPATAETYSCRARELLCTFEFPTTCISIYLSIYLIYLSIYLSIYLLFWWWSVVFLDCPKTGLLNLVYCLVVSEEIVAGTEIPGGVGGGRLCLKPLLNWANVCSPEIPGGAGGGRPSFLG